MNDLPKPEPPRGHETISRRDFVLARLWRSKDSKLAAQRSTAAGRRKSLTMRYPKSLEDVAAGDPTLDASSTSAPTPLPAPQARRRTIPVLRPPGAIDEPSFLAGCTRCEACIKACPYGAIVHAPIQLREAAGTPMIDADRQPCLMCADFPCITACEPGVLTTLVPPMMGTARITEHLCVAYHGSSCRVCHEACPVPQAILIDDGKPTVNDTRCTGCGVCRAVCPAPENAILLMPTFLRPMPAK